MPRNAAALILLLCLLTSGRLFWQLTYFQSLGPVLYRMSLLGFAALFVLGTLYALGYRQFGWGYAKWSPAIPLFVAASLFLIYAPLAVALIAFLLLACYSLGGEVLRLFALQLDSALELFAFSTGLGLGLLTLLLFLIGLARGFYAWVFVALLLVLFACGWVHLKQTLFSSRWLRTLSIKRPANEEAVVHLAWLFAAALILCAAPVILTPSVAFDAIRYHLPAARFYFLEHRLMPVPLSAYSYYPQGLEVLMTLAYSLGGQLAAQMVTPALTCLFAAVNYRILRVCEFGSGAAFTGLVCALSLPFVHWSGAVAKNDSALGMYQALSLLAVLRWNQSKRFGWILLSAFFLGCSFGIKHVALFGALPLVVFSCYAAVSETRWIRALLLVGAMLLLFGTFWQIRTYLLTGNPVFPEGTGLALNANFVEHHESGTGVLKRYGSVPWRVLWDAQGSFESPLRNPSGIALLALAPVWLFVRRRKPSRAEQICLVFCLLYLAYWCTVLTIVRYAIVPLCLLAGFAGARLWWLSSVSTWPVKAALCSAFVYCEIFALSGIVIIEWNVPQIGFLAHRLNQEQYLREALLTYESARALSTFSKPGDRVFGVNNCSALYAPETVQFHCALLAGSDAKRISALAEKVIEGGNQYLLLKRGPEELALIGALGGHAEPGVLWQDLNFSVYRLRE